MPIRRADGVNDAERYLKHLCESTFLTLWSYSGVHSRPGKELCDLLVFFDNHIIIFSDKDCKFPSSKNLDLDWQRWFRSAIFDSAKQAWGAERQIKKFPQSLFLDSACTETFPMEILDPMILNFHIVVVAHDSSRRCQQELGGSGSLLIASNIQGHIQHNIPFFIGDIDPNKTFVHILDNTSLDIVLSTLDTTSDFVDYLTKKEKLLRSNVFTVATGEEDLLAYYLQHLNVDKRHDFIMPFNHKILQIDEIWEDFKNSPLRQSQELADKVSYVWDWLIEEFSKQMWEDNLLAYYHQYLNVDIRNDRIMPSNSEFREIEEICNLCFLDHHNITIEEAFKPTETSLRFLAREDRFNRRILSGSFCEWIEFLPKDKRATRYMFSPEENCQKIGYVFLSLPHFDEFTFEQYLRMRSRILQSCCIYFKSRYPQIEHIVGISIQPNNDCQKWFPQILYIDAIQLTQEDINKANELGKQLNMMTDLTTSELYVKKYPDSKDTRLG
ncbi:MAG: hypothetical protein ACFKPT_11305 [Gloeotrichia echinulata GP01]